MTDKEKLQFAVAIKYKQMWEENHKKLIGGGYDEFWETKKRYRVVKGGRSSKKSTTTAMWYIDKMMEYPLSNLVCIRKTGNTHKNSTFAELKKACIRYGVLDKWKFNENPCEGTYLKTGQKILFRGFDEPLKLTSLTVEVGVLCWAWWEEVYEIDDEEEFNTFDEGIRGEMPGGLWKQLTLTYNPWINSHWTKKRFFDSVDPNAFALTTTHKCNEFLDELDHQKIEDLQVTNPDRYQVVGLGEYGMPGGSYFDEFRKDTHVIKPFIIPEDWKRYTTKDYGLDMLANYWIAVDYQGKAYVYKELYESNLIISSAVKRITEINNGDKIYEKFAPPDMRNRQKDTGESIQETFEKHGECFTIASNDRVTGWYNLKEWLKPYETTDIQTGEKYMTADLVIFNNCKNLIRSIKSICSDEKDPNDCATEPHEITHAPDAIRYWTAGRPSPTTEHQEPKKKKLIDTFLFGKKIKKSIKEW